jgi:hypothetical protein
LIAGNRERKEKERAVGGLVDLGRSERSHYFKIAAEKGEGRYVLGIKTNRKQKFQNDFLTASSLFSDGIYGCAH